MQRFKVELLPEAWAELDRIADIHLNLVGPNSAQKITDNILNSLKYLEDNPYMGAESKYPLLAEQGFRILVCGNYLCFYKVGADVVEVYHIADGRRDYPKLFF